MIEISEKINADLEKVWKYWTQPEHIKNWNSASDDWHTVNVENELKEEGRFVYRMEAKDGSAGFDFGGTYTEVREKEYIKYKLDDERNASISFKEEEGEIELIEAFEPEFQNSEEMQKQGWHAILRNFKEYVENN